jgi:hypothetical protein
VFSAKKSPFQGFTVWVGRGNGPLVEDGFATSRNYTVKGPLPAAGTVEIWHIQISS